MCGRVVRYGDVPIYVAIYRLGQGVFSDLGVNMIQYSS